MTVLMVLCIVLTLVLALRALKYLLEGEADLAIIWGCLAAIAGMFSFGFILRFF